MNKGLITKNVFVNFCFLLYLQSLTFLCLSYNKATYQIASPGQASFLNLNVLGPYKLQIKLKESLYGVQIKQKDSLKLRVLI